MTTTTTPAQPEPSYEQICDMLEKGNPTDEECRLVRLGWVAALTAAPGVQADWQPMDTAPTRGMILLMVEHSSGERRVFASEASHEDGEWRWIITTGWVGWTPLHSGWTPVLWQRWVDAPGAATAQPAEGAAPPIDMVLHCPKCGVQHIDAPESDADYGKHLAHGGFDEQWSNPPHRSHLCHGCGHIWRPADVPTNGVRAVKTQGKADSPIASPGQAPAGAAELAEESQAVLAVRLLLCGIDRDETHHEDGWWPTSHGVEFGTKKLREVEALVRMLEDERDRYRSTCVQIEASIAAAPTPAAQQGDAEDAECWRRVVNRMDDANIDLAGMVRTLAAARRAALAQKEDRHG